MNRYLHFLHFFLLFAIYRLIHFYHIPMKITHKNEILYDVRNSSVHYDEEPGNGSWNCFLRLLYGLSSRTVPFASGYQLEIIKPRISLISIATEVFSERAREKVNDRDKLRRSFIVIDHRVNRCHSFFFYFLNREIVAVCSRSTSSFSAPDTTVLLHPESYLRLRSIDLAATILTCASSARDIVSDIVIGCPYA